ncbi:hypothetical protein [Roseateles chitinivorans]|uniref:hypothetical protein n=1 Tax=Roseateles chitinivorans TaxID=2917965 RepID=UPI00117CEF7C|nr:hypothetical protein [Roseateles chitinivorans]
MSIERQVELLNDLVQVMHNCANGDYEEMSCVFRYLNPEDSWSIDTEFSFVRNGEAISAFLRDPRNRMIHHVRELHALMKSHTGGDWKSFVLQVGPDGKAHTKFSY